MSEKLIRLSEVQLFEDFLVRHGVTNNLVCSYAENRRKQIELDYPDVAVDLASGFDRTVLHEVDPTLQAGTSDPASEPTPITTPQSPEEEPPQDSPLQESEQPSESEQQEQQSDEAQVQPA